MAPPMSSGWMAERSKLVAFQGTSTPPRRMGAGVDVGAGVASGTGVGVDSAEACGAATKLSRQ